MAHANVPSPIALVAGHTFSATDTIVSNFLKRPRGVSENQDYTRLARRHDRTYNVTHVHICVINQLLLVNELEELPSFLPSLVLIRRAHRHRVQSKRLKRMELLEARHDRELDALRQEMREKIKKAKKSERAVVEASAIQMEFDMKARHREEMDEFEEKGILPPGIASEILSSSAENAAAMTGHTEEEDERERIEHKKEKAKKKKDKKAQKEKEREEEKINILAAAAGFKTLRDIEIEALGIQLNSLHLSVRDVPSDGHCLYRAIADQLRLLSLPVSPSITEEYGVNLDFKNLRKIAANHLRSHREQFAPFICSDTDSTHFDEYCHKVESEALAEWGGQIEIRALAEALGVEICVHSADSAPLRMSPDGSSHWGERPVLLSFHRHLFNLGEHYNSLVSR